MKKTKEKIWFDGSIQINCDMKKVKSDLKNIGKHFVKVTSLMPGIKDVKLLNQKKNSVTIENSEGIMNRINIKNFMKNDKYILDFDEEYKAEKMTNAKSHYLCEFSCKDKVINFHLTISDVQFPGFLGLLYRKFGSRNIGNAILKSYKDHFEKQGTY